MTVHWAHVPAATHYALTPPILRTRTATGTLTPTDTPATGRVARRARGCLPHHLFVCWRYRRVREQQYNPQESLWEPAAYTGEPHPSPARTVTIHNTKRADRAVSAGFDTPQLRVI